MPVGGGGAWPGTESTRRAKHQRPGATGVEGTGGTAGPGCGARGRWRDLAGLRADAPSEARGADGSRAGRRPRAHRAARPTGQNVRRPEHQRSRKQQAQSRIPAAPPVWRAPEGPEDVRGPGCGARGRWRGLAGLRADAPSEARGADGSRAGRRPRAHRAAQPTGQNVRRPEHQRAASTTERRSLRTPRSTPGSGRPGGRRGGQGR